MPLSLDAFNQLTLDLKCMFLWQEGTHIATRYEEEDCIGPYRMPGFFAEAWYDQHENRLYKVTTFVNDPDRLEDYAAYITLPEDL